MRRCLITGGCGFVGRRFARRLLNNGWRVLVVDDLSAGLPPEQWMFKSLFDVNLDFCIGDFRDWICLPNSSPDDYELIFHLAAVVGGRLKIDGDPLAVATDLAIDADLFNWVVKAKRKPKVVYFSSSAVYPVDLQSEDAYCTLSENLVSTDALRFGMPDMTYGWAKLTGELLVKHAVEKYGADVVIYRPFSGYGEDQSFDYPFPSIIKRIVDKEDPVVIWGSGYQVRDFIYIEDIIDIVLGTMHWAKPGEVLNLGSGQATSFRDLAALACYELGHDAQLVFDLYKPIGTFYRVADISKMLNLMFKPTTTLAAGIKKVADAVKYVSL